MSSIERTGVAFLVSQGVSFTWRSTTFVKTFGIATRVTFFCYDMLVVSLDGFHSSEASRLHSKVSKHLVLAWLFGLDLALQLIKLFLHGWTQHASDATPLDRCSIRYHTHGWYASARLLLLTLSWTLQLVHHLPLWRCFRSLLVNLLRVVLRLLLES